MTQKEEKEEINRLVEYIFDDDTPMEYNENTLIDLGSDKAV